MSKQQPPSKTEDDIAQERLSDDLLPRSGTH